MKLHMLAKDRDSGGGNCPAMYLDVDNPSRMVTQGKFLDEHTAGQLKDVAADETGVWLPTETVLHAVAQLLTAANRADIADEIEAYLAGGGDQP